MPNTNIGGYGTTNDNTMIIAGYNLTAFCKSKGYEGAYLYKEYVYGFDCGTAENLNQYVLPTMEEVCRWQYKNKTSNPSSIRFIYYDEENPYSGSCMYPKK